MMRSRGSTVLFAVAVLTAGGTIAVGAPVLIEVPPWSGVSVSGGTPVVVTWTFTGVTTDIRALTPDGLHLVGTCTGTETSDQDPPATRNATYGMIWDATNNARKVLSSDNAIATTCLGTGYRTVSTGQELLVMGLSAGWPTYWRSTNDGVTWGPRFRDTSVEMNLGTANTMSGSSGDEWWGSWSRKSDSRYIYIDLGWGDSAFFHEETFTPANVEVGDTFILTVSGTAVVSYTAAVASVADVTAGLAAAWAASADPLCTAVTATDNSTYLNLKANVAGVPFSVVPSTTNVSGGTANQTLTRVIVAPAAATVTRSPGKSTPTGETVALRGVSATGRSVGFRKISAGARRNWYVTYAGQLASPANAYFDGLKGDGTYLGEAWAITADGNKVVGFSPTATSTENWPYLYTMGGTAVALPTFPDVTGGTRGCPYHISADGSFASGHNYRGTERAVLWDVRDGDPANWKVYDLTMYAQANGQAGNFTRLARAYSVANTATDVFISGIGVLSSGALTSWRMQIPLSDFPLEAGACCVPQGGCAVVSNAEACTNAGGSSYGEWELCTATRCPSACCHSNSEGCTVETSTDCTTGGGTYIGGACSDSTCKVSCCETDGNCDEKGLDACTAGNGLAGTYGSTCNPDGSTCTGACCEGQNNCSQKKYGECPPAAFKGVGVACPSTCGCSGTHSWADINSDGDVDMDDFGAFQLCYTGTGGTTAPECACFDHDGVNGIDGADFLMFDACDTGPDVAFDLLNPPLGCSTTP